MIRSVLKMGVSGVLGVVLGSMLLLGSNLWTYTRLTNESEIGTIRFSALGGERYLVTLNLVDGDERSFELAGDEWQLDTRIIKWKAWANLLGRDTFFQLDRVSGRYSDAQMAQQATPSLVDLRDSSSLDLWSMAHQYPDTLFMIDAQYGSSVFLPMYDGAGYRIGMASSGVLARPIDGKPE